MKRSERRALEKELRQLAMEELRLDPEHDARMTEWVKAQYEQAMAAGATKPARGKKIGRRVLVIAATAMLLMVFSFAYTVFTPDAVSHAKGFVHRATIWVNDVLHLGLEIEVPPEDSVQTDTGDVVYYSLEEAAAALPHPLVYLKHPDVELESVTTQQLYSAFETTLLYRYGATNIDITLMPIGNDYAAYLRDTDDQFISWEAGNFTYWDFETYQHAISYYAGMEIELNVLPKVPFDTFTDICHSLALFN